MCLTTLVDCAKILYIMTATHITKRVRAIDKQIDKVRAELKRREPNLDEGSAQSWQDAWDKHPDLRQRENALFLGRDLALRGPTFEVHTHCFVSGPRSHANDKITHSHPGGGSAHTHPNTGPSFYGYRAPKLTAKPTGEQLETIPRTDEENTFDLVITDSARYFNEKNEHVLIGDMPVENIRMFAAETMKAGFRMKCNVRDERTKGAR